MGDLGKGGDVRVNSGDAGIESVEKVKLVEEAHAPLHCHRVCDPSAVAGHPVLGYTPVHYCGLADTGALCIPTPGAYQSGDRGVPVPASGVSTQESVQPHRECGRTTAVVQEGSQSQNSILVPRASIIVSINKYPRQLVSSPVGILAS